MTSSAVIRLAQEGDAQAITMLINQQLNPRGITAQSTVQGDCLHILLESPKTPPQEILVQYLREALTRLAAESIQSAQIYGRPQGEEAPVWVEGVSLHQAVSVLPDEDEDADEDEAPSQPARQRRLSIWGRCLRLWAYWQFASLGVSFVLMFLLAVQSLVFAAIAPKTFFESVPDLSWRGVVLGENLPQFSRELAVVLLISCFFLGLILGDAQTEVLQQRLRRVGLWKWATALGVPLGLVTAIAIRLYGYTSVVKVVGLLPFSIDASIFFGVIMPAVAAATGYAILGGLQWLSLVRRVPRSYRWPLSTLISGGLCGMIGSVASNVFTTQLLKSAALLDFPNIQVAVSTLMAVFIAWVSFHAVTGVTLARIIHKTPKVKMRLKQSQRLKVASMPDDDAVDDAVVDAV
ncbi:MAG: hypothetical protein HC857_03345 [Synechococcales cyanobacterium RU_4_20]|nr:hypothetical protein [Synechococcales cyanobacterium RU_4_20]